MVMRFIAGVICPACGEKDTLRADVSTEVETQYRECVDCGFSESTAPQEAGAQPDTRVDQHALDDGRQVIKIMPPANRTKH